jgi:TonB family protein
MFVTHCTRIDYERFNWSSTCRDLTRSLPRPRESRVIKFMFHRIWPAILLVVAFPAAGVAVGTSAPLTRAANLQRRELHLLKALTRSSQFANVAHISSRPSCEDVQPPEALATPDPLFAAGPRGNRVKVSFIIGTDGRVHSPLILESAGLAGDRHVLETVRTWRYRPATCNGVPTETEGKIEFSSQAAPAAGLE